MVIIKDMNKVSRFAKEQWLNGPQGGASLSRYKWAVVEHPFTNWERIVSCHEDYEGAKRALASIEDDLGLD